MGETTKKEQAALTKAITHLEIAAASVIKGAKEPQKSGIVLMIEDLRRRITDVRDGKDTE